MTNGTETTAPSASSGEAINENSPQHALAAEVVQALGKLQAELIVQSTITMESAAGEGYIIAPKGKLVEAEGEEVPELSELKCMDLELAPLTLRVDATSPAAAQCKEGEVVLRGTGEIQERYGLQAAGTNAAERAKQEAAALDGGAAGGTTGGTQRTKKRKMMAGTSLPANAVSDGIFRAAPPGTQVNPKEAVVPVEGLWSVMVDLEGEAYQAFFDTPEDAHLALVATGHSPIDA